jgi:hypothetical protein
MSHGPGAHQGALMGARLLRLTMLLRLSMHCSGAFDSQFSGERGRIANDKSFALKVTRRRIMRRHCRGLVAISDKTAFLGDYFRIASKSTGTLSASTDKASQPVAAPVRNGDLEAGRNTKCFIESQKFMLQALLKQCLAMPIHNSQSDSESKSLLHSNSTEQTILQSTSAT